MIINPDLNFVYIAIPKTASKTIQYAIFGPRHPEPSLYHISIKDLLLVNPGAANMFKFAFVRNPWGRLVSMYHDFKKQRVRQYSGEIRFYQPLLNEFTSFQDFCMRLGSSYWFKNLFFKPQFEFLCDESNNLAVDFVGRYENLIPDLISVCTNKHIPMREIWLKGHPFCNVGNYSGNYREYYTKETIDIVRNLYKKDVEAFGYDF